MSFATIDAAIAATANGEMIILVDDEERENEGDLVVAAEHATSEVIAFMATRACGLICLALEGAIVDRLALPMMTTQNRSRMGTAFTVSIEAREGVTTGISAGDRARTIAAAIAPGARPQDLVSPGHVFPLRAQDGGVLVRAGQTEGSVDLARLAGCRPAAVICEIMNEDGTMARRPRLEAYAEEHDLLICTVADLIAYRERQESLVELVAEGPMDTPYGPCHLYTWRSRVAGDLHFALAFGERLRPGLVREEPVLVRVHKESVLSDAFHIARLPGRADLDTCLAQIAASGDGLLLYLRDTPGRQLAGRIEAGGGIIHDASLARATAMDPRDYGIGAQILRAMGVRQMRLVSASDGHIAALKGHGLRIVDRVPPAMPTAGERRW